MNALAWLLKKEEKAALWDTYDWSAAEKDLFDMQADVAAAAICGDEELLFKAQRKIVNALTARMLAVRHVSGFGAGIDGVRLTKSHHKMSAALRLNSEEYHASPTKLIVIQPKRGKERNIRLATMFDRAVQTLHSYTVAPVAEAKGDRRSFAFRPHRSAMDAHVCILKMFSGENAPEYAVVADVKACYESISHAWLLKNIPMDKQILKEILGQGYVFDGELFPPDEYGLSIGSTLSPILANMVLDGLQSAIYKGLHGFNQIDYANGYMVRFADDIVVAARSKEDARQILSTISGFLRKRGLALSPTKTKICSIISGFNFLSRRYQLIDEIVYSRPSDSAIARFEEDLREFISTYKGSQLELIEGLNAKLRGWAGYHKFSDANDAFRHIDAVVKTHLLDLCESKHKRMFRENILKKYFFKDVDGEHVYALAAKKDVRVVRLAKTPLVSHKQVNIGMNPFTNPQYFEDLAHEREINNVTGKYRAVWTRQDGNCFFCGAPILPDQPKEIAPINAAKDCAGGNMAYVHSRCRQNSIGIFKTTEYFPTLSDSRRLLEKLASHELHTHNDYKFDKLKEYLWEQSKMTVTLKFSKIEEILGFPLSSRSTTLLWWHKRWANGICEAGIDTGYVLQNVNFKSRRVTFTRDENAAATLKIPEAFLKGKMPADAVTELTAFFEYIRGKYGI